MSQITTNLTLTLWNSLTDPYDSSELVDNFVKIDLHDHATAGGVKIPFAGIASAAIASSSDTSSSKFVVASDTRLSDGRPPDYFDVAWDGTSNLALQGTVTKSSIVRQTGTLSTNKTVTLPLYSSLPAGSEVIIQSGNLSGGVINVRPYSGDKINGTTDNPNVNIGASYAFRRFINDGTSGWVFDEGVLRTSNNLSELTATASTARTNLGLGDLVTFSSTAQGTSATLAGAISDETGTGSLVFGTSPSLTTPKITGSSGGTTTIASAQTATGKTITFPNVGANANVITSADSGTITTAMFQSGATIDKANALATPRKINGVPFDGAADISLYLFRENDNLPITQTYTDGTVALSGTTLTLTPAADVTGLTLTASSPSTGYVTYTKNSHSFYVGETVVIAGFGAAGSGSYNGTFRIISKTTNTFTVVNTATGGTPGSSGTAHSVFDTSMVGSILTVTISGTQRFIPVVGYIDTLNLKVSNSNNYSFTTQAYTSIANTLSDGDEVLVHTETNALPYVKNNGTSVYSVPISAAVITGEDGGAGTGYVTYTTSVTQAFSYGQELTIVGTFNGGTGYTGTFTTTSSNPATGTFTVANASASGIVTSVTGGGVSVINTDTVIHMRYTSAEKHWDYLGGSPSTTRDSANVFATSEQFTNATTSYTAVDGAAFTFFYQGIYNLTISCNAFTGGALTATVTTTSNSGGDGSQTYTTSTNPHNLLPGDKVVVTGLSNAANNGTFTVFSTPAANTFVVWNPSGTASTGQSGTATFYHENTIYVNASTTTPANDYYAAVLKGVNTQSDISLSRPIVVTARNTTYNLYLKTDSVLGTPKIKNWSVTLTPLYYL